MTQVGCTIAIVLINQYVLPWRDSHKKKIRGDGHSGDDGDMK